MANRQDEPWEGTQERHRGKFRFRWYFKENDPYSQRKDESGTHDEVPVNKFWCLRASQVGKLGGLEQKRQIRSWWDSQILIWYPLIALIRLAHNSYATYNTFMSTGTVTVNLFTDSCFAIPIDVFNWTLWITSINCLSVIYPIFVVSYYLLWWFNILFGHSNCDQHMFHPSTRRFQRKQCLGLPTLLSFNAKLLILRSYLLHACRANLFGEHINLSSFIVLTTGKDHSASVLIPWWTIVYDYFPRYPPEGFIMESNFFPSWYWPRIPYH